MPLLLISDNNFFKGHTVSKPTEARTHVIKGTVSPVLFIQQLGLATEDILEAVFTVVKTRRSWIFLVFHAIHSRQAIIFSFPVGTFFYITLFVYY
jgi:uncharacterized membrane protein YagU involved in acid resistance